MSCRIDILHHIVPVSPGDKLKIIDGKNAVKNTKKLIRRVNLLNKRRGKNINNA